MCPNSTITLPTYMVFHFSLKTSFSFIVIPTYLFFLNSVSKFYYNSVFYLSNLRQKYDLPFIYEYTYPASSCCPDQRVRLKIYIFPTTSHALPLQIYIQSHNNFYKLKHDVCDTCTNLQKYNCHKLTNNNDSFCFWLIIFYF